MSFRKNTKQKPKRDQIQIIQISSDSQVEKSMTKTKSRPKSTQKKQVSKENTYNLIPEIPQIRLTKENMKGDPLQLLIKLERQYQQYGAVKLVAPPEWKPPFSFKYSDKGITTRIQHLHKLKFGKVLIFFDAVASNYFSFRQRQEAYNIKNFTNYAKNFETSYRFRSKPQGESVQEREEQQYWNLVNGNYQGPEWKYKTTIQYAADLPVNKHGSGFPLSQNSKTQDQFFNYHTNYFNLNNTYKSPFSLLKIAEDKKQIISGVISPWVYMGMMFSTFCWHVEDLWLNSLNYSHTGKTKTWYVIPKRDKEKFEAFVAKKTGRTDLLNRITYMMDPMEIMAEGITVYKANQRPGNYICTFFKAYHAGFSHGFNVGEAVNFISPRSLAMIKEAENYIKQKNLRKPSVLPYEWIVYGNRKNNYGQFNNMIKSECDKILKKEYKFLEKSIKQNKVTIGSQMCEGTKYDKNSCSICRNYQYLSSLKCEECKKNYCQKDFRLCCDGNYQLIIRSPDDDRLRLLELLDE